MISLSAIGLYIWQTLMLWGERLFATDAHNPHYRYAWAPPIRGRQVGLVICTQPCEVTSVSHGPVMECE